MDIDEVIYAVQQKSLINQTRSEARAVLRMPSFPSMISSGLPPQATSLPDWVVAGRKSGSVRQRSICRRYLKRF